MLALEELLRCPMPAPEPFDDRHFDQCFLIMITALKRRNADDDSGKLLVETYRRMLRHLPKGAINYVSEQALVRSDWLPSVKECLELAAEWTPPVHPLAEVKRLAQRRITDEKRLRFNDAMALLARREMPQEQIDDLPEQWKMIAVERCYLWLHPDQTFTVRADPDAGRFEIPAGDFVDSIKVGGSGTLEPIKIGACEGRAAA